MQYKPNSHATTAHIRYSSEDRYTIWIVLAVIAIAIGGAAWALAQDTAAQNQSQPRHYQVTNLSPLGGTNARGNSINDRDWIAGYSTLPTNQTRHAALWRNGNITDLGTLGGPNSTVA